MILSEGTPSLGTSALATPGKGVQYDTTEVIIAPVSMEVAASEAEASAARGPFVGPCHVLDLTFLHLSTHVGIAGVRAVTALHSLLRRVS